MTALDEGLFVGSEATGESRPGPQVWLEQSRKLWYCFLRWEGLGEGQAGSNAQELDFGQTELKTPVRHGDVRPGFGATFYTPRLRTGKNFLRVHSQAWASGLRTSKASPCNGL